MPVFTNILVAIDGSDASQRALSGLLTKQRYGMHNSMPIYVVETGLFSSLPPDNTVEIMYRVLENEGKQCWKKQNNRLPKTVSPSSLI